MHAESHFLQWHGCYQSWLNHAAIQVAQLQASDWRLSTGNKGLNELVQMQTYYLQELKKNTDEGLAEMWKKLQELWTSMSGYCQVTSQLQDEHSSTLYRCNAEIRSLHSIIDKLLMRQLPEVTHQVYCGMQLLSDGSYTQL